MWDEYILLYIVRFEVFAKIYIVSGFAISQNLWCAGDVFSQSFRVKYIAMFSSGPNIDPVEVTWFVYLDTHNHWFWPNMASLYSSPAITVSIFIDESRYTE